MTILLAPLKVEDQDFMVAATIDRCPKIMMARELVKNALEAAVQAPPGDRRVEVRAVRIDGHVKLAVWNTGPGMDADELLFMTNIAASVGKQKGLNENFGMGAKVAALPSNQRGMRYRSCKAGRVHQVTIAKVDGVYGRRRYDVGDGELVEVVDVTDLAAGEGHPLHHDWTEVVLLGNRADQDTVFDPYDGDPRGGRQWLADDLYHRFYRMPESVRLTMKEGTHKLDGNRTFKALARRIAEGAFARSETVRTEGGIAIHYVHDPQFEETGHNRSFSGALQTDQSTCAVVYRDEMYDVRKGRGWTKDAPVFGITFGGKHLSVHIELPDGYAVLPEGYRRFLRYTTGPQDQVQAADFADLVLQHRPQWVVDIIRELAPDSTGAGEIRNELQRLLNDLRIRRAAPRPAPNGEAGSDQRTGPGVAPERGPERGNPGGNGGGGGRADTPDRHQPADLNALPPGARRANIFENTERAPEVHELRTPEEVAEKTIEGRAALYVPKTNQLFVNLLYPAVDEMKTVLEDEYADVPDTESMRVLARAQAEKHMALRVGRAVVFALAKRPNRAWTNDDVAKAMSPESLSLAADDYIGSLVPARVSLGGRLRPVRRAS